MELNNNITVEKLDPEKCAFLKHDITAINRFNKSDIEFELSISDGELDAISQDKDDLYVREAKLETCYFFIAYMRYLAGLENHNTIDNFYNWLNELKELYFDFNLIER